MGFGPTGNHSPVWGYPDPAGQYGTDRVQGVGPCPADAREYGTKLVDSDPEPPLKRSQGDRVRLISRHRVLYRPA